MKGVIKIVVLIVIALASFAGYVVLFSVTSGLKPAQAFSFSTPVRTAPKPQDKDATPPAATAQKPDSISDSLSAKAIDSVKVENRPDTTKALIDSLQIQLTQMRTEKAELEKIKSDVTQLLKAKSKADSLQLYNLAKMYDGVDPDQLATVMSNMNDSLITVILPRLKSQKAGKILQSMPADRAARISSKLLGVN
jgi:flagellar motility protein MotE (MotC chaperone)